MLSKSSLLLLTCLLSFPSIILAKSHIVNEDAYQLSRIDQIALTGKYKKALATRDKTQKKKVIKKISKKKKKRRNHVCLGGSYKAFNRKARKFDKSISKYSKKYNIPEALIKAVITAESCFNPKAVSPKGAQGLMQLMPGTAKRFGISNSFNPDSNINGGTRYLKYLFKYFDQDLLYVVAAYNAGEGAVDKYGGVPPYKETRGYVSKVAALYKLFSQGGGIITAASFNSSDLAKSFFRPRAMARSRFSPYKGRIRNISRGNCSNRTGTRLRKTTMLQSGQGVWQRTYLVRKGDTLSRIMQKTGIHKNKIAQMNGLRSRSRLSQGQTLLLWECRK